MAGSLGKKFRGWFFPKQFIPHYQHTYKGRHSSFVGPVIGLRQAAHVVDRPSSRSEVYLERFVYVGCIHGGNEDIYGRLEALAKYPPDYLIFAGDITGSVELERLKKHFYKGKEEKSNSQYAKYAYFGDWAATLPKIKREKLLDSLQESAPRLLKVMEKIKKQGTAIYIIEGNWDSPLVSGVKAIGGEDIKEVFDTEKFFARHGYHFINNIKTLKTKTALHIFLPYITILHFGLVSKYRIREIKMEAFEARSQDKTVIIVGHAETDWKIHHLAYPQSPAGQERRKVIGNFSRAMAIFRPDEVIYPHQHARIRDEKGNLLPLDAKYVLQVDHNGVHLVENPSLIGVNNRQIVATYVPFGYLAQEDLTRIKTTK